MGTDHAQAQEAACLATGARLEQSPAEYEEAVASLWKDADPQVQQVLCACGIEPPDEEEPDPRTMLHRYLAEVDHPTTPQFGAKKAQLQLRADKIKAQFEKAVQDLADVLKEIEQAGLLLNLFSPYKKGETPIQT